MSPRSLDEGAREFSFPRVSGDEPATPTTCLPGAEFSPREWG